MLIVIRIVLILLLLMFLFWLWRSVVNSLTRPRPSKKPSRKPGDNRNETMVSCTFCQLHVPSSEAIYQDSKPFCGDAHRQEWLSKKPH